MARKGFSGMRAAALAATIALAATSALAQRASEPGMSGCPDGTKDGVLSNAPTPMPGGGCADTVYREDDYRSGKRGVKPSAPKSEKDAPESSDAKKKSTKERQEK